MFRASGSIAWKGGRLEDPWSTPVPFGIVGQDQDEWRHPSGAGLDRLQTVISKNHQSGDYYHWTGPRRVAPFKRCRSGTSKQFIIINDARWSRPSFEQDQDEWRLPSGAGLDRSKTIVISIKSFKDGILSLRVRAKDGKWRAAPRTFLGDDDDGRANSKKLDHS